MQILNIAEKPSVAKSISYTLSNNCNVSKGIHKYCSNIRFKYDGNSFTFTSVLGHLYQQNFIEKYIWEAIDPEILFYKPIHKTIPEDFIKIKTNIEQLSLKSDLIIIWTDCDREGEHIAQQISNIIHNVTKIDIKRARFSAISRSEICKALDNLGEININEAAAVDARMELDLRIGSSFTILQTLALKDLFREKQIISFGPCQIPTLGFVVERYNQIENFVKEPCWSLKLRNKRYLGHNSMDENKEGDKNVWKWKRNMIFDKNAVIHFYNKLLGHKAIIQRKVIKDTVKLRPLPLRTVELQKTCSSIFKISSHKIMEIAESLYNKGYISYPRTETDVFNRDFNYKDILNKLHDDNQLRQHVDSLLLKFKYPRQGKNNDMAHSPIYPLKSGNGLSGMDRSIFDFISKRFLGGLCEDAKGKETYYELNLDKETFYLKGHNILERNYLDVYTYDNWEEISVDNYSEGDIISYELFIDESSTAPPSFLTESELITLMDKNGIGTDATIHEHIQKIQERKYAIKKGNYIMPEKLGIGLIRSYVIFNLEFSKPVLRKNLEIGLKRICNDTLNKNDLVTSEIETYKKLFNVLKTGIDVFKDSVKQLLDSNLPSLDKKNDDNPPKKGISKKISSKKNKNNSENKKNKIVTEEKVEDFPKFSKRILQNSNSFDNIISRIKITNDRKCKCNNIASKQEVKNGENRGKVYYSCFSLPKKCNYFEWEDGKENIIEEDIKCNCGYDPQILVAKTAENAGKQFYKCKKSFKPCKFFKWV